MKNYAKLLRIEQWVKNLFVFIPAFFSRNLIHTTIFWESLLAFFAFCFIASSVYILNDYVDIESDKIHPEKCNRPLASGKISLSTARILFFVMIILSGLCISILYSQGNTLWYKLAAVLGFYFLMNVAYSLKLKHIPILDICIISLGFVLRVFAGGYATGLLISKWTILLTFVLALVLAIGKRRGELVNAGISGKTRKALDGYNIQFADIALSISVTIALICYVMFTMTPEVQSQNPRLFYTVLFVFFALLRYLQQTLVFNKTESPTKIIYKDRYIQISLLLWVVFYLFEIYY